MTIEEKTIKKFKKMNSGDIMGVVRTLFPGVEVETLVNKNRKNKP